MRTTVTINDELLAQAKFIAAQAHTTIGAVLEDALRQFIRTERDVEVTTPLPDFHYEGGLQPGVDLYDKTQMSQLLGNEGTPNAVL